MFRQLRKITEVLKLKYVMRTRVKINNLIEHTQNYLNYKRISANQKNMMIKARKKSFPKLLKFYETSNNTKNQPKSTHQNPSA